MSNLIDTNTGSSLFTDKYRPKKYCDLLTEEKINREILTWMKSWDEIVFHRKFTIPKIPIIQNEFSNSHSLRINQDQKNKPYGFKNQSKNLKNNDLTQKTQPILYYEIEYVQSKHKILLISGPPGTGKTTLASIIADHCGYEPVVVNASDERTTDRLLTRIYDTTLMHNIKKSKKPTCLILDEIDGIAGDYSGTNSIRNIIDFVKYGKLNKGIIKRNKDEILSGGDSRGLRFVGNFDGKLKKGNHKKDNEESDDDKSSEDNDSDNEEDKKNKKATKKKDNANTGIKRPIICICNDIYAKALTLLRKEALVYNIKRTDDKKMVDRLFQISQTERLPLDKSTIKNICELTKYDIRASLNCLQFISYNKTNVSLISTLSRDNLSFLGNKDINENLFNIWSKLFFGYSSMSDKTFFPTYTNIKALYNSSGVPYKIIEGLYYNYLKIQNKNKKQDIESRAELTELFSYEDTLSKKGFKTMSYDINNYSCMSGNYLAHYYQCEKFDKTLIEYPSIFYDMKRNSKISNDVIERIRDSIEENGHKSSLSRKVIVSQLIPYVYQLIQPSTREINIELMNQEEQKLIKNAINIMILCGINFKESGFGEMSDQIQYEPDISKVLMFNNNKITSRLSNNQKIIMKMEYDKVKSLKNLNKNDAIMSSKIKENEKKKENNLNMIMNTLGMGKKRKMGQFLSPEYKFIYKYNEGVTNCVRRSLNVNYFFEGNK